MQLSKIIGTKVTSAVAEGFQNAQKLDNKMAGEIADKRHSSLHQAH